jgi:protein-tyrosine phosphatase
MIDLHLHIIPGVDDGASDYGDSIEMAELALECGVSTIVATPHANQAGRFENYYTPAFARRYERLGDMLRSRRLNLRVLEGQEIMASEDMAEKIEDGSLIGLNHTQYYLVEFPFDARPDWITDRLLDVIHLDKIPVIAHVERYFCVQHDPGYVYRWIQMGCVIQMNKGSVFGKFGRGAQKASVPLLNYELIHCIASDAHSPFRRTPWLGDIQSFLIEKYDEEYAHRMLQENPYRIITGQKIVSYAVNPRSGRW